MAASTARYQFYDFFYAALQTSSGGGTPSIVTTELYYPNQVQPSTQEIDVVFEGGGNRRHIYLVNEFNVTFDQDCLDLNAMSLAFGKNKVTTLTDSPFATEFTWMGETAEGRGVSAGFVGKAHAIKNVGGTETAVDIILWVPLGTLTLAKIPGFKTSAKGDMPGWKYSATRTSTNIIGGALTSVPSGGAMYAIGE